MGKTLHSFGIAWKTGLICMRGVTSAGKKGVISVIRREIEERCHLLKMETLVAIRKRRALPLLSAGR